MNNVYIVTRGYDYEGFNILSIFSTFEKAKEYLINEIGKEKYEEYLKEDNGINIYAEEDYGTKWTVEEWDVNE